MITPKEVFMEAAIDEAKIAKNQGDYAIGAVIVKEDEIIVRAPNQVKFRKDPTQHAELAAIQEASEYLDSRYLEDCILYTTHEPCAMCAAAAVWSRMKGIVFGARMEDMADYSSKNSNADWKWRTIHLSTSDIVNKASPKPEMEIVEGFMRDECKKLFHSN